MDITIMSLFTIHLVQVIHDCRAIAGCLNTQFGVKLTNVFDTQVHVCTVAYTFQKLQSLMSYASLTVFMCSFSVCAHVKVADVMCFYSETGGFLPDRVSTLQEVVSLHLKVPSSQLLSLQMKSKLTKVWFRFFLGGTMG